MPELKLDGLNQTVAERVGAFFTELIDAHDGNIHSLYITGSALTDDFDEKTSDINTVAVLKEMDLQFLETLAPKGQKFRKKKIAAPLVMTPEYVRNSTDAFPVEFLNFSLLHHTVYGEDIFGGFAIEFANLRLQCERDLKVKLIGLRQGYLSAMGDAVTMTGAFAGSITSYIPLFRAIIKLKGAEPPFLYADVLRELTVTTGVDCGIYERLLKVKRSRERLSKREVDGLFEEYYKATVGLDEVVNAL